MCISAAEQALILILHIVPWDVPMILLVPAVRILIILQAPIHRIIIALYIS